MDRVEMKSQIRALEMALGRNGPGVFREGHLEVHRKHLEGALQTLRTFEEHADIIATAIEKASQ